jgi:hypothetical protein
MFAFKPRTEIAIRALLIMAVVFNALIPTAAAALPLSEGSTEGNNGSTVGLSALSPILQQDDPQLQHPRIQNRQPLNHDTLWLLLRSVVKVRKLFLQDC